MTPTPSNTDQNLSRRDHRRIRRCRHSTSSITHSISTLGLSSPPPSSPLPLSLTATPPLMSPSSGSPVLSPSSDTMTTRFSSKSDVASCGVGEDEDEERGLLLLRKRGRSPSMERRDLVDEAMGGESVKKKRVRRGKTRRASLRSTVETKVEEEKAEVEVVVEKELENVDDDASLPMLSPVRDLATTLGCTCSDMNSEGLVCPTWWYFEEPLNHQEHLSSCRKSGMGWPRVGCIVELVAGGDSDPFDDRAYRRFNGECKVHGPGW